MGLERKMQRCNAQALAKYARSLPQVDLSEALRPGVCHAVYSHDDWCPTLRSHSMLDCRCTPTVRYHRDSAK